MNPISIYGQDFMWKRGKMLSVVYFKQNNILIFSFSLVMEITKVGKRIQYNGQYKLALSKGSMSLS